MPLARPERNTRVNCAQPDSLETHLLGAHRIPQTVVWVSVAGRKGAVGVCPRTWMHGTFIGLPTSYSWTLAVPLSCILQSGTGKTGAFAIGLLGRMDWNTPECQALVLSPTRELALQTQQVISHIGDFLAEVCICMHRCLRSRYPLDGVSVVRLSWV